MDAFGLRGGMCGANPRTACEGEAERSLRSAGRAVGLRSAVAAGGAACVDRRGMRSTLFASGRRCTESGQGEHGSRRSCFPSQNPGGGRLRTKVPSEPGMGSFLRLDSSTRGAMQDGRSGFFAPLSPIAHSRDWGPRRAGSQNDRARESERLRTTGSFGGGACGGR
jgi:hypothetical protein